MPETFQRIQVLEPGTTQILREGPRTGAEKAPEQVPETFDSNASVVLCLVYAAILTILAGRRLHAAILRTAGIKSHRAPLDRFARLFVSYADRLLDAFGDLLSKCRSYLRDLAETLARQALDPNIYLSLIHI